MRVLTELHHGCLYESLCLLFEDRFGWELYRPIGMEWYQNDYWVHERAWHGDAIAHQYLDPYSSDKDCGTYSEREDWSHPGRKHKLLTLEQARSQRIDIVLCTLLANQTGFHRLAEELGATYGIQTGNVGTTDQLQLADFVMFSTSHPTDPSVPFVTYHQEFSLGDFHPEYPIRDNNLAATWVHGVGGTQWFPSINKLAQDVPDIRVRCYGHKEESNPYWQASLSPCRAVADSMRSARIGLHYKTHGDGYGHIVHNLFACGLPVVGTASYYRTQIAGPLFVDGVTSFDVQTRTNSEVAQIVRRLAKDDDFRGKIAEASAARFREVVDFDADAQAVKAMLERVLK